MKKRCGFSLSAGAVFCLGAGLAPLALGTLGVSQAYAQEAAPQDISQIMVEQLVFNEAPASQVFQALSLRAGVEVTPLGSINNETITIISRNEPLETVIRKITVSKGWRYWKTKDGLGFNVSDEAYYLENVLPEQAITKVFRPDHVKAQELESAISNMLTPGIGKITPDPRTNKLIVFDLPEVIERVERLIREIDVQLYTRVFYIRHGDVAEVAQKIESYKSDPGTIELDEITHQIIVTDLLSNIKKMELLIDILDVGPDIVIYDVNNIGLEGEDLEDLQTIIEGIRTPELLFEINANQGVFILEDVPEVHERVEQILAGFDQPVKQVLIQGEILSTTFDRNFGFGVDSAALSDTNIVNDLSPTGFTPIGRGTQDIDGDGDTDTVNPAGFESFVELTGNTISGGFLGSQAKLEYSLTFNDTDTKTLLQPRLLVRNQESSRIFVGREEPFLTTFFSDNDNNNSSSRSTSQSTVTSGLTFDITPSISNSYLVEMEIQIDNDDAEVVTRQSTSGPVDLIARNRQSLETVLTIPSGQTRVIGGLLTSQESRSSGGVPFLSKLPIIGALFGKKSEGTGKDNLQLFITPTIVEDILPRPTGTDGKRGRLVTAYERVPGNYGLNEGPTDEAIPAQDNTSVPVDELFSTTEDGANVEAEIETLLRDTTPRVEPETTEPTPE
ncbi:MAG: secretin N-terminal domain-containing protein [Candidatus Sumerlaeia bacterium]|nr:secretin N-terminal domain-containing protein [Candidatus Sumerlaeia bacterium]